MHHLFHRRHYIVKSQLFSFSWPRPSYIWRSIRTALNKVPFQSIYQDSSKSYLGRGVLRTISIFIRASHFIYWFFPVNFFFRDWKISRFWWEKGRWREEIPWCYQQQKHKALRKGIDPCQTVSKGTTIYALFL